MRAIIWSNPAKDGSAIGAQPRSRPAKGRGSTLTLGATSPTYWIWATDPSGSGTFITWFLELAAMAVPAMAATAIPAKANAGSFLTKSSSSQTVCDGKFYEGILNARLSARLRDG